MLFLNGLSMAHKAPFQNCDMILCIHIQPLTAGDEIPANRPRLAQPDHQSWCWTRRGYSTQAEKDAAKETKGVRVISLTQFQELLNWGILMGVCALN